MVKYRVDTIGELKEVLNKYSDDIRVESVDDVINIYKMVNHRKYEEETINGETYSFVIADDWQKEVIAEISAF